MYNRYLDAPSAAPLPQEPPVREESNSPQHAPTAAFSGRKSGDLLKDVTGGLSDLLGGVLKHFSLESLDTGDILLVLILLFLFLEGDNLELVITLGLMLLLGLGED